MDTKLTIQQIHLALRDSGLWNKRTDIMIPNLSWGLLPYEADFVVVSKSGYLTKVEFCRTCWCGIPRDTCTSLGTCDEHDNFAKAFRKQLMDNYYEPNLSR